MSLSRAMDNHQDKKFLSPIRLSVLMPVYNERFLVEACVRRVLAFKHPMVREIELIVVDDASTDGTRDILRRLAIEFPQLRLFEHPCNQGKGAAIRLAIKEASGELSIIQDADLEYNPEDWALLLKPFIEQDADAVYGSRFLTAEYRRVLYFWHTVGNQFLTLLSNFMTDLNLTDMETCYKMIRTELLKSIPIRSNDFSMEPEITAKLAKRGAIIYEVPIRYAGRTYQEGKKITARHGFKALYAILKWKLIDDLFQEDEYGSAILASLNQIHQFNKWIADFLNEDIGSRVLEIGAGMGTRTVHFLPRARYVAADVNHHYLAYLTNMALGKPYLEVVKLDVLDNESFKTLTGQFDTAICISILENLTDERLALQNIYSALTPGGKAVVMVPQGGWLYSSLDQVTNHHRRYEKKEIIRLLEETGFKIISVRDFNRISVLAWLLNGKILQRKHFSHLQLKLLDLMTPLIRQVDRFLPWEGLNVVAVGQK